MTTDQQQPQPPPQDGSGPGLALLIILVPASLFLLYVLLSVLWLVSISGQD